MLDIRQFPQVGTRVLSAFLRRRCGKGYLKEEKGNAALLCLSEEPESTQRATL
jgi:hypothetical protein